MPIRKTRSRATVRRPGPIRAQRVTLRGAAIPISTKSVSARRWTGASFGSACTDRSPVPTLPTRDPTCDPPSVVDLHLLVASLAASAAGALVLVLGCAHAGGAPTGYSLTGPPDYAALGAFQAGMRVRCHWRGRDPTFSGQVTAYAGGRLHIVYDDQDTEDITPGLCRPEGAFSSPPPPNNGGSSCGSDRDCKGDRVCVQGSCVSPR
jgi:hypothetical protein